MIAQIYSTGEVVCVGDIVEIDGRLGQIVACIECGQYDPEFPESDWSYLKTGFLWKNAALGLVHVSSLSEPNAVFIRREGRDNKVSAPIPLPSAGEGGERSETGEGTT
jgi:hypothetical protein